MTGNEQWNGIRTTGATDGASCAMSAKFARDSTVAFSFPGWNELKNGPHAALEISSVRKIQRGQGGNGQSGQNRLDSGFGQAMPEENLWRYRGAEACRSGAGSGWEIELAEALLGIKGNEYAIIRGDRKGNHKSLVVLVTKEEARADNNEADNDQEGNKRHGRGIWCSSIPEQHDKNSPQSSEKHHGQDNEPVPGHPFFVAHGPESLNAAGGKIVDQRGILWWRGPKVAEPAFEEGWQIVFADSQVVEMLWCRNGVGRGFDPVLLHLLKYWIAGRWGRWRGRVGWSV